MITDEEFYRFIFWYCGDSKKTAEDAVKQWYMYYEDDDEKRKEYDEFNKEST